MQITLIGTGNVAHILGRLFISKGYQIRQVVGRDLTKAKALSLLLNADHTDLNKIDKEAADLFIIAVSDQALESVIRQIGPLHRPVFHTAGAVSMHVLEYIAETYGVLYPLQTLRKEALEIPKIPFLLDASTPETLKMITDFAGHVSEKIVRATDEYRLKIHMAAVFVNNFTNHLYGIAEDFCLQEGLDFEVLKPLILETANKIILQSPLDVQTGPAIRGDHNTLEKHLQLLNQYPAFKELYIQLSESILQKRNR